MVNVSLRIFRNSFDNNNKRMIQVKGIQYIVKGNLLFDKLREGSIKCVNITHKRYTQKMQGK